MGHLTSNEKNKRILNNTMNNELGFALGSAYIGLSEDRRPLDQTDLTNGGDMIL